MKKPSFALQHLFAPYKHKDPLSGLQHITHGWQQYVLPLFVLVSTTMALLVSIQFFPSHLAFNVEEPQAKHVLSKFYPVESYEQNNYRWSGEYASLMVDGFWARPIMLNLRMSSPRPPTAPQADMHLETTWKSGDFVVDHVWRHYNILVPVEHKSQEIHLKVDRFTPPGRDSRSIGIALSSLKVTVPTTAPWRFPSIVQILLAIPLPLLTYAMAYWLVNKRLPTKTTKTTFVGIVIALCLAAIAGFLSINAIVFPLHYGYLLPLLWFFLIFIASIVVFISTIGLLQLPHRIAWLSQWMNHFSLPRIAPWTRTDYALVSGMASIALLLRILLLPNVVKMLNGDDYLVGIFALNILNGEYPLYYGETGTLASYLITPVLLVKGASLPTLLWLPLMLSVILTVAIYGIGRDLFGRWGGIAAASWIMVPPAFTMLWTCKLQPGYIEAVTIATLALWATIRLCFGNHTNRTTIMLMGSIGLATALALWSNLVVLSLLGTCGIIVLVAWKKLVSLPRMGYALLMSTGGLLFTILVLPAHIRPDHGSVKVGISIQKLQLFADKTIPELLGITRYGRADIASPLAFLILGVVSLALLSTIYQALFKRNLSAIIVLILIGAAIGAALLSNYHRSTRYFFPLAAVAMPLLMASMASSLRSIRYSNLWVPLFVVSFLLSNSISSFGNIDVTERYQPRVEAVIADVLLEHNVRYVYTSYWIGMGIMFESGNTIISSSRVGPNRESYDPRNEERVLAANGKDTAFVFRKNGVATPAFEEYLHAHHIDCEEIPVSSYVIYNTCTPFPDVPALIDYLP